MKQKSVKEIEKKIQTLNKQMSNLERVAIRFVNTAERLFDKKHRLSQEIAELAEYESFVLLKQLEKESTPSYFDNNRI